jgi:hypothetical protein
MGHKGYPADDMTATGREKTFGPPGRPWRRLSQRSPSHYEWCKSRVLRNLGKSVAKAFRRRTLTAMDLDPVLLPVHQVDIPLPEPSCPDRLVAASCTCGWRSLPLNANWAGKLAEHHVEMRRRQMGPG